MNIDISGATNRVLCEAMAQILSELAFRGFLIKSPRKTHFLKGIAEIDNELFYELEVTGCEE